MSDAGHSPWFDLPLPDLSPAQRQQLDAALRAEGIPATWGGTTLRVDQAWEARLTTLVAQVRQAAPLPPALYAPPPPAPHVPPGPYVGPPSAYVPAGPPTNTKAILSLILGIASLVACCGLSAPVGLWLGLQARTEIRQRGEQGDGMAIAGIATSAVGLAVLVLALLYVVFAVAFAIAA